MHSFPCTSFACATSDNFVALDIRLPAVAASASTGLNQHTQPVTRTLAFLTTKNNTGIVYAHIYLHRPSYCFHIICNDDDDCLYYFKD